MSPEAIAGTIWIGVFAFAIVVELMTVGLTSIWFAGGALISSIAAFCGAGVVVQIIIFMVVSVVLLLSLRPIMKKKVKIPISPTNADEMIGQIYTVLSDIGPGKDAGQIKVHDVEWRAVSENGIGIPAGHRVRVLRIEGTKLIVEQI
jgi:membrane protein implicated in regulation of membrane protease activity